MRGGLIAIKIINHRVFHAAVGDPARKAPNMTGLARPVTNFNQTEMLVVEWCETCRRRRKICATNDPAMNKQ